MSSDEATVRAFLTALHDQARSAFAGRGNPGVMQLVRINPNVEKDIGVFRFAIGDVEGMSTQALADAGAGYNVYVEGRIVRHGLARTSRGTTFDTVGVFALVADSDSDKGKVAQSLLDPSMIVGTSPGNEHHWYFFDRALTYAEAAKLGQALRSHSGADSDTGNIAQPYRVAGTPNYPSEKKRTRGRVETPTSLVEASGCVYTQDQFQAAYPIIERAQPHVQVDTRPARELPDLHAGLSEFRRWQLAMPPDEVPNGDRSAHFFNVSGRLKSDGYSLDEAEAIWRSFPDGAAVKYLEPRDRLRGILEADWNKLTDAPPEPLTLVTVNGKPIHQESAASDPTAPDGAPDEGVQFSVGGDWTRPGGLIGDIAEWIMETARRPNLPISVAAAVSIVGTVCGRHIATPTSAPTNLYIVCIGETAFGKDRPLKAISKILIGSGLPHLAQTGKFMSASAVENAVLENACHCAVVDEIGNNLFARMSNRRASTHESGIASVLRELWSSGFDVFLTSRRAGERSHSIQAPSLSIFGASTTDEFYNSLGAGVVENGLLNRFLIVKAAKRAAAQDVDASRLMAVPKHITDGLLALLPVQGGNLVTGAAAYGDHSQPHPLVVPWASDAVRQAFTDFDNDLLAKVDAAPEIAPYLGRTAEMAIRLATVYAVSRFGRIAAVTQEALGWGVLLATQSAQVMFDDIRDKVVKNEYQARYKFIESVIRAAKGGSISGRDLNVKINGWITRVERDNIIDQLVSAGKVAVKGTVKGGKAYDWVA